MYDIAPFEQIVRGRIALLGDAGHSTTPDIGQGGCAAMKDAVVLGQAFIEHSDIETALQAYQKQRVGRVKDLVLKARKSCNMTHGSDMAQTLAWYDELKFETGENIMDGLHETIANGPLG